MPANATINFDPLSKNVQNTNIQIIPDDQDDPKRLCAQQKVFGHLFSYIINRDYKYEQ